MMPMRPVYAKGVSGVIAAAALGIIYGSLKMPMGTILTPAAGLVPLLLGCGTFVLALAVIFGREPATAEDPSELEDEKRPQDARAGPRPFVIMAVLGLVIFAFERAGFIATLLGGIFFLLRFVEKRPLAQSLILSSILSGGLYLLFTKLLFVNLPRGWLEF